MSTSTSTSDEEAAFSIMPRQAELLRQLKQRGHMSISEMVALLSVSEQTIRRDLKKLDELHLLTRFHGGASSLSSLKEAESELLVNKNIELREVSMVQEKKAIAQAVADLIPDGSTVFITIGTTVERIAAALAAKQNLMVITDSLRVAALLYRNRQLKVLVPSGQLSSNNGGIEGPQTLADLNNFRADFFISSIGAIAQDGTLLDFNLSEVEAAKVMLHNAKHSIIAGDHTKFSAAASIQLGHLKDIDYFVTDKVPTPEAAAMLESLGLTVIEAAPEGVENA